MDDKSRFWDLNIDKILDDWTNAHAVRELIANALDEQVLSKTRPIEITKDATSIWTIRDYGRGLRIEHCTQNENPEKLKAVGQVIGKFGIGLKDAMATLNRNSIEVEIESSHGVITVARHAKHGFSESQTLHAVLEPPRDANFIGTAVRLKGLPDEEMANAKGFFLKFSCAFHGRWASISFDCEQAFHLIVSSDFRRSWAPH